MSANARNGITVNTASVIDGISGLSSVDGIVLSSGLASFSDNFNRANQSPIIAPWTQQIGTVNLTSNAMQIPAAFDNSQNWANYSSTPCSTINQYVLFTSTELGNSLPSCYARFVNAGSPYYEIRYDVINNLVHLFIWTAVGGSSTEIGNASITLSIIAANLLGMTIQGTGAGTILRVWLTPAGNAPDAGGTTWGSAAPTATVNGNGSSTADTGIYVGLGCVSNPVVVNNDNFFGGDVP